MAAFFFLFFKLFHEGAVSLERCAYTGLSVGSLDPMMSFGTCSQSRFCWLEVSQVQFGSSTFIVVLCLGSYA